MTDFDILSSSRKNRRFGRSVESMLYCNSDGCFITASFKLSTGMRTGAIRFIDGNQIKSNVASKTPGLKKQSNCFSTFVCKEFQSALKCGCSHTHEQRNAQYQPTKIGA